MKPGDYRVRLCTGGTMRVTLTSVDPRKNLAYVRCEDASYHDDWIAPGLRRHRTLYLAAFQSCIAPMPKGKAKG